MAPANPNDPAQPARATPAKAKPAKTSPAKAKRPPARPNRGPARASRAGARRRFPIVPVVLGIVGLLALVAVVATGGDDGGGEVAGLEQTRPVSVEGDPLARYRAGGADPAVGTAAPEVQGATFDGTPVAITADGRPKVLVFLAHWCPHCQREVPVLAGWLAGNGPPGDVDIYGVATSTSSERPNYPPSEWLREEGFTVPTLADDGQGSAAVAFGLSSFPYYVVLDGDHQVLARGSGELSIEQWESLVDLARTGAAEPAA